MTTFSSRLRELSAAASAAPWRAYSNGDIYTPDRMCVEAYKPADAALIVALRNRAERIADLADKVAAVRAAYGAPWHSVPDMERVRYEAHNALFAALDALDRDETGSAP